MPLVLSRMSLAAVQQATVSLEFEMECKDTTELLNNKGITVMITRLIVHA